MMRFVVDAQLPPPLVDFLRSKGHQAEHVMSVLGEGAKDSVVVAFAREQKAVIVSKDADFVTLLEGMSDAPPLLRIRVGNATNKALIAACDEGWRTAEQELLSGKHLVELG